MLNKYVNYLSVHLSSSLYLSGAEAYGASYFGQEVASIQFDNVTCTGLETNITECSSSTNVSPSCGAQRLAGVTCFEKSPCEDAGFTGCCQFSCNQGGCYCDQACHGFGDCCANVDNICPLSSEFLCAFYVCVHVCMSICVCVCMCVLAPTHVFYIYYMYVYGCLYIA